MKAIKTLTLLSMCLLLVFVGQAQERKSPPAETKAKVGNTAVTVNYSKPSKRGRDIFGGIVPYGEVWRTGANESSWIEFSSDVKVEGKSLAAGRYGLFTIPGENEWVIIFNSVSDKWGAFSYQKSDDVLRVNVKPTSGSMAEVFDISIDNGNVVMAWDETRVSFSVE